MTEAEWLACSDPLAMLALLRARHLLTERKSPLFAAACCRRLRSIARSGVAAPVLKALKQYADGRITREKP